MKQLIITIKETLPEDRDEVSLEKTLSWSEVESFRFGSIEHIVDQLNVEFEREKGKKMKADNSQNVKDE